MIKTNDNEWMYSQLAEGNFSHYIYIFRIAFWITFLVSPCYSSNMKVYCFYHGIPTWLWPYGLSTVLKVDLSMIHCISLQQSFSSPCPAITVIYGFCYHTTLQIFSQFKPLSWGPPPSPCATVIPVIYTLCSQLWSSTACGFALCADGWGLISWRFI